jgi:hypothetical protein
LLARITDTDGLTFSPPPLFPSAFGVVGVDVPIKKIFLNLNTQVRWVGPRGASAPNVLANNFTPYTLPSYADLSATISTIDLRFSGAIGETKIMLTGNNLIGVPRSEPGFGFVDIPTLGRTFPRGRPWPAAPPRPRRGAAALPAPRGHAARAGTRPPTPPAG